jgi:hypothetical protein
MQVMASYVDGDSNLSKWIFISVALLLSVHVFGTSLLPQ